MASQALGKRRKVQAKRIVINKSMKAGACPRITQPDLWRQVMVIRGNWDNEGSSQFIDWTVLWIREPRVFLLDIQEQVTISNFGQCGETWFMIRTGKMKQPIRWQPLKNRGLLCVSSARLATTLTVWTCSGEGVQSNQASEKKKKIGIKKPTLLAQKRPKPFSV